jgi:glycosyltransferase involved in cell wall biosynthesis
VRILVTLPWGQRLGGAEAMIQSVLAPGAESGHELEPVFFEDGPWPQELREAGLRVKTLSAGRLREPHRWVATVCALTRLMRERQPDVVLNWSAKTQLYGAPAAVLAGIGGRVAWWQQSIPEPDFWLDRLATRLPARAIGCYSRAAAEAQARLSPRRPTFVVAPGSPPPEPSPSPVPVELPAGIPVVGIVGRLQPWKGQDRLLRAHALLHERGLRAQLLVVGGDAYGLSAEYAESLPPLAGELGLEESVTFTGQVPDAGPYVERMDILVNASDPEPFGIVLLEGMARGVAVVAVDSGGPAEFVVDGVTGALARSGEPAALADAIEVLLRSESLRRRVADAGHESYLREFTDAALRRRFFTELTGAMGLTSEAPLAPSPA